MSLTGKEDKAVKIHLFLRKRLTRQPQNGMDDPERRRKNESGRSKKGWGDGQTGS